jgi:CPA1 family monovalent cation:H+ antiporter
MELIFQRLEVLLVISCLVAILARKLRFPYTVGLLVTGLILASLGVAPETHLSKDLIFTALLPPLIFEAAFQIPWSKLKPDLFLVTTLATGGVFLAGLVTTLALVYLGGQSWQTAIIIGVILSATDPVSVLALLKEAALPARIHRLIESESLFNDGTAAVLFTLAPIIIAGSASAGQVVGATALAIAGGVGIGAAIGFLSLLLSRRTEDHLVEITVTVVAAYASFLVAEEIHVSGVLSTLTAGMILGNLGHHGAISEAGRETAHSFWEFAGFISNSLIFLLIGIDVFFWRQGVVAQLALWTIAASLLGRACAVYLGCLPFRRSKLAVPRKVQHLLVWGGLRGALALALVLGLPETTPDKTLITSTVFYAVAFSIVVQGLTVGKLIRNIAAEAQLH